MRLRNLLPGVLSRQIQGVFVSLLGVVAAGAFAVGAGCGGATNGAPLVGGESHFLRWCSDDCEQAGLQCISGLCTQPCVVAEPSACSAFSNASCTAQSIEPGAVAVCDVSCTRSSDCSALGSDYRCDGSFCRAPALAGSGANGLVGTGGTTTLEGSGAAGTTASGGTAGSSTSGSPACAECLELDVLTWSFQGNSPPGVLFRSELSNCNNYYHQRVLIGADDQLGSPECTALVDGCPARELAVLNATLQDPVIQLAFAGLTLFGRPSIAVADSLFQISYGVDSQFFVGAPCNGMSGCIEIPPAVTSLVAQLQALDAIQMTRPPCSSAFPNGAGG